MNMYLSHSEEDISLLQNSNVLKTIPLLLISALQLCKSGIPQDYSQVQKIARMTQRTYTSCLLVVIVYYH